MRTPMRTITAILPEDLIEAIDAELARLRAARKGLKLSRADFIRAALYQAVSSPASAEKAIGG